MIHLAGPLLLAAALAGTGIYGLLARRNAIMVLIGAELLMNAANVLLVTASTLPAGGLSALARGASGPSGDPLIPGQVMAVFVVTIAAAEIGLALAVILLLFRRRSTSDLTLVTDLGEASESGSTPPRQRDGEPVTAAAVGGQSLQEER
ncbi:MAG: NADH-quinone oxidoreductase subunit [Actinomycetota bacterium]|nr:NADH-quinone oxidoreductase subunit [Actinomycetota bacterium]